jgi:hypothetical protein
MLREAASSGKAMTWSRAPVTVLSVLVAAVISYGAAYGARSCTTTKSTSRASGARPSGTRRKRIRIRQTTRGATSKNREVEHAA